MKTAAATSEKLIVFLIAAVQFVNIVDFMMVMPLGPDFARAMGIRESNLGFVAGSYTASAALSGLLGARFLDGLGRRRVLGFTLLGLSLGTFLGGWAQGLPSLLMTRVVAGFFGGPATAVSLAIIADVIPASRRGRAMGAVMMSVSLAQILGVPLGLELAERWGWRAPFFVIAALGLCACLLAVRFLPPLRGHLEGVAQAPVRTRALLARPMVQGSYLMTALAMMGGFILIPNISAYVQYNLGLPREALKWMYFIGGLCSLLTMRVAGRAVDLFGSFRVGLLGSFLLVAIVATFFVHPMGWPVGVAFSGFMVAMGLRNVAYNTLTSKVPGPRERARFQSFQSFVQHLSSAGGAFLSSQLLSVSQMPLASGEAARRIVGMEKVGLVSIGLSALLPGLMFWVERAVRLRQVREVDSTSPGGLHP